MAAEVQSQEGDPTAQAAKAHRPSPAFANSNAAPTEPTPSLPKHRITRERGLAQIERKHALARKSSQRADSDLALEHPPDEEKLPSSPQGIKTRRRRAVLAARVDDLDDAYDRGIADVSRSSRPSPKSALREADLSIREFNKVLTPAHAHQPRHSAPDLIVAAMPSAPPELQNVRADRSFLGSPHRSLEPHNVGADGPRLGSPHRSLELHNVGAEGPLHVYPHRLPAPARTAARRGRVSRGARASAGSFDLLQLMVDIFMWKHVPRSALLFGFGFFCIVSMSHLQEMHYSVMSVLSYTILLVLAVTFVKHSYLRRGAADSLLSIWVISETDALAFVRAVLPPINAMLLKLGELFCGEPVVTFKVALVLWFLAQAGTLLNLWTFVRLAYFAVFTIPKCYSTYREHLHGQANVLWNWVRMNWDTFGHKRAVLIAALVLTWKLSSIATRLCGAFLFIVALHAYRQHAHIVEQQDNEPELAT